MLRHRPALLPPSRHLRVSVHLAALLLLFLGFAQATHHHGSITGVAQIHASGNAHNFDANDPEPQELTCPLCIASQTVLPSFAVWLVGLQFNAEGVSLVQRASVQRGFWSYSLFSRPPPASEGHFTVTFADRAHPQKDGGLKAFVLVGGHKEIIGDPS